MTDLHLYRRFALVVAAIAAIGVAAANGVARHGGRTHTATGCAPAATHCGLPPRIAIGGYGA